MPSRLLISPCAEEEYTDYFPLCVLSHDPTHVHHLLHLSPEQHSFSDKTEPTEQQRLRVISNDVVAIKVPPGSDPNALYVLK